MRSASARTALVVALLWLSSVAVSTTTAQRGATAIGEHSQQGGSSWRVDNSSSGGGAAGDGTGSDGGAATREASWTGLLLGVGLLVLALVACALCVACRDPSSRCHRRCCAGRVSGSAQDHAPEAVQMHGGVIVESTTPDVDIAAVASEWTEADAVPLSDWLARAPSPTFAIYPLPTGRHVWPGWFASTSAAAAAVARGNAGRTGTLTDLEFRAVIAPAPPVSTPEPVTAHGSIGGGGRDRFGPFTLAGAYNPATAFVGWSKQYVGGAAGSARTVEYRGVWHGTARRITGLWFVPAPATGGVAERGVFEFTAPASVNEQVLKALPLPNPTAVAADGVGPADIGIGIAPTAPVAAAAARPTPGPASPRSPSPSPSSAASVSRSKPKSKFALTSERTRLVPA